VLSFRDLPPMKGHMSIKRSLTAIAIALPLLATTSGQSASRFSAGDFVEGGRTSDGWTAPAP
jgi:hypothetical protein